MIIVWNLVLDLYNHNIPQCNFVPRSRMSNQEMNQQECQVCRDRELERVKTELADCQKRSQSKDRSIKKLNHKVFVLTAVAVAIGAIFGKEALDSITEWIGSINSFNSSVENFNGVVVPAPSTVALFAMVPFATGPWRRRR